jgi:hypothetical protein
MNKNKGDQLNLKVKLWKVILAIIIVNSVGIYLRYFNLNTYIILLGFRFHISFVFPLIVVFNSNFIPYIKRSFINPEWRKSLIFLFLILLPLLIEMISLYILQKIDLGDPEYFYEFGISSIADYPIYLIWNFPQMILLYFFLVSVASKSRFRFISVASVIFLLFTFELISNDKIIILFWKLGILASCSIIFSILINYFRNIYWFGISLFTILWLVILAFGSSSKTMINLLFASKYDYWDGIFEVANNYLPIALQVYFGIALIISCIAYLFYRKHHNKVVVRTN